MKKIMIAVAAMAMAVAANAASVNWEVTGSSAQNGYKVYVMSGSAVTSWESVAAIESSGNVLASDSIKKITSRSYGVSGTATDASITKSSNFYYIIVNADATQYAVSSTYAGSSYVYDTTATPPEAAPSVPPTFAANNATFSDWAKTDDPITPPSGDVPEPTSGLLLLVGAAGLALRRRLA